MIRLEDGNMGILMSREFFVKQERIFHKLTATLV